MLYLFLLCFPAFWGDCLPVWCSTDWRTILRQASNPSVIWLVINRLSNHDGEQQPVIVAYQNLPADLKSKPCTVKECFQNLLQERHHKYCPAQVPPMILRTISLPTSFFELFRRLLPELRTGVHSDEQWNRTHFSHEFLREELCWPAIWVE